MSFLGASLESRLNASESRAYRRPSLVGFDLLVELESEELEGK